MTNSSKSGFHESALASFRDPGGRVVDVNGRKVRLVNTTGANDLIPFMKTPFYSSLVASERLVRTATADEQVAAAAMALVDPEHDRQENFPLLLEHERVLFQSYPYEWSPPMLDAAATLTLDLAEQCLDVGYGLKDATPYNILFRGPNPVFVDLLSFEQRNPLSYLWWPYAQFVRTFLLPLLANRAFGLTLDQSLTTRRDGLEPEAVYRMCDPIRRLLPPFLGLVSFPVWASTRSASPSLYRDRLSDSREKADFILRAGFRRLRRFLRQVRPRQRRSGWTKYMEANSYSDTQFSAKTSFVEAALAEFMPKSVLDVGCNTGFFSALSARSGARVVAIDNDPAVAQVVWKLAREQHLDILPLVVNLALPSPATGWRNMEQPSFLQRARGAFDAVLMLAVIHHMLVTERVPLDEIIDLAAEMTTAIAILEYVGPQDAMFRQIARGRDSLHANLTPEAFETACSRRFDIVRAHRIGTGERILYLLKKRQEPRFK